MSNSKNLSSTSIAPTSSTPEVAVLTTTQTPATAEKQQQASTTNQTSKPNNVQEVFERLKAGNHKQRMYEEFTAKLDNVKTFREKFDGGGLTMTIENPSTEDEITITNLDLILSTLDRSIKMGNDVKERIEMELLNMGI